MEKYVNISIVTYNRLAYTKQCIQSLLANTEYPHVITVVDNCSNDETGEYLLSLKAEGAVKNVVLLHENIGVAKASNKAWLMEPGAEYYLKLDNDIVIQNPSWLDDMVTMIEKVPVLGAIAYNVEKQSYPIQEMGGNILRPKVPGTLGGACILIPKRTEKLLGYWCEDYGLYGEEDTDYGMRIQIMGLLNAYMEDEKGIRHIDTGDYRDYIQGKTNEREKNSEKYQKLFRNVYGYLTGTKPVFCSSVYAKNNCSTDGAICDNDLQTGLQNMHSALITKDYDRVVVLAENLLRRYPGMAFLHNYLEATHRQKGNHKQAQYHREQALIINPYIFEIRQRLSALFASYHK